LRYGLLVAAGRGVRYGAYKQFVPLLGRPVFIHSAQAFDRCRIIVGFVVVAPPNKIHEVRRMLLAHRVRRVINVVAGGMERTESVRRGLAALPEHGWVAVHDAARPLINSKMLAHGFLACRTSGAATFGFPVSDTIKLVRGRRIVRTVDRARLIAVQTPQFFNLELLRRAHASAHRARLSATDDCALVERLGVRPVWIPGPRTNLKVTTHEDMRVIQALM
jgi:2-C-methyl-D-erythritol 4-phosphate cytidylyltransferase